MGKQVEVPKGSPFTLENIPFGCISTTQDPPPRCAIAIGKFALDLRSYSQSGHLSHLLLDGKQSWTEIFGQRFLNHFAALPSYLRRQVRSTIITDLQSCAIEDDSFVYLSEVTLHIPFEIGGFSDFYCSLEHSNNCAAMSSGVIPKNWFYSPSVYNSRVSSVVPSSTPIRRPKGVYFKPGADQEPIYAPSEQLDFELEMGYFVSKPVPFGETLDISMAKEHIFGFVMLNDWSSRDLQVFEMKPLGPFHSKGFGTTISTWVVTLDALESYSCVPKTVQDPLPFAHLKLEGDSAGTWDINLRVTLQREGKLYQLASSNLRYLYWTPYQQITHHASAMCGLKTGDLMGTGTISGDGVDEKGRKTELGCLYEATQSGAITLTLPDGKQLTYLNDGDEISFEAWCEDGSGEVKLGFGECKGILLPSII